MLLLSRSLWFTLSCASTLSIMIECALNKWITYAPNTIGLQIRLTSHPWPWVKGQTPIRFFGSCFKYTLQMVSFCAFIGSNLYRKGVYSISYLHRLLCSTLVLRLLTILAGFGNSPILEKTQWRTEHMNGIMLTLSGHWGESDNSKDIQGSFQVYQIARHKYRKQLGVLTFSLARDSPPPAITHLWRFSDSFQDIWSFVAWLLKHSQGS